jgi:hypothetical protein
LAPGWACDPDHPISFTLSPLHSEDRAWALSVQPGTEGRRHLLQQGKEGWAQSWEAWIQPHLKLARVTEGEEAGRASLQVFQPQCPRKRDSSVPPCSYPCPGNPQRAGCGGHGCNPSRQEAEARSLSVPGSLSCIVRPCLKKHKATNHQRIPDAPRTGPLRPAL